MKYLKISKFIKKFLLVEQELALYIKKYDYFNILWTLNEYNKSNQFSCFY
jgi:hypothetical protein